MALTPGVPSQWMDADPATLALFARAAMFPRLCVVCGTELADDVQLPAFVIDIRIPSAPETTRQVVFRCCLVHEPIVDAFMASYGF